MPESLGPAWRERLDTLAEALVAIPQVRAVALGGSHARGSARPESDVDVSLYYRDADPVTREAVDAVAARFDPRPARVVTEPGVWGPWVDGGAWLRVDGRPLDLLYRSLDLLDHWLAASERGERAWHYEQQPAHGFHSHMLLAELSVCVPLRDPEGVLAERKARAAAYPEALRGRLVQDFLWHAEFSLYHARVAAERGDVLATAGCLDRAAAALVQVLHAERGARFFGDKGAAAALDPAEAAELAAVLGHVGTDRAALRASTARLGALFTRIRTRLADAYHPLADLTATRSRD